MWSRRRARRTDGLPFIFSWSKAAPTARKRIGRDLYRLGITSHAGWYWTREAEAREDQASSTIALMLAMPILARPATASRITAAGHWVGMCRPASAEALASLVPDGISHDVVLTCVVLVGVAVLSKPRYCHLLIRGQCEESRNQEVNKEKLLEGARKVIACGSVRKDEKVVIVTDTKQSVEVCLALFEAVNERGGEPVLITMNPAVPGGDLPHVLNEAMKHADLIITPTSTSIYHSTGIREACLPPNRARLLALSECNEETLTVGGIHADFEGLRPIVDRTTDILTAGSTLVLTTPAGTRLEASIAGRTALNDCGIVDKPNMKIGYPVIEVFLAPVEESVRGRVVVDASGSGGIGVISEPIILEIEKGRVVSIEGGEQARKLRELLEEVNDPNAFQVAEIAVGMNPECRVTGNIIEDEGAYGTCHIALGDNMGFGGLVDVPVHIDLVQWKPTLEIDGTKIFELGEQLVDVTGPGAALFRKV